MSGGCVEGAVYEVAREVPAKGTPAQRTYGVSNGAPEETAVAIAAEIIALGWGGSGQRLAEITAAIHR